MPDPTPTPTPTPDPKAADPAAAPPAIPDDVRTKVIEEYKATLPKAPDKYDVKLPDGSTLPATVLETVSTTARALGLSNENAQRLADLVNSEATAVAKRLQQDYSPGGKVFESQRQTWQDAALKASDIGNGSPEVLQAHVARVTTLVQKYFPDDVRTLINDTGIGSHPGFFRGMAKLAEALKEDGWVKGPAFSGTRKSLAQRLYPEAAKA